MAEDKARTMRRLGIFMILFLVVCGTGGYLVTKDQIAQITIGGINETRGTNDLGRVEDDFHIRGIRQSG